MEYACYLSSVWGVTFTRGKLERREFGVLLTPLEAASNLVSTTSDDKPYILV